MTNGERRSRGARAGQLLANETFRETMLALDQFYRDEVFRAPDVAAREAIVAEYHASKRVIARLHSWVQDGSLAED